MNQVRLIGNAENFLNGFNGYIHADGYPGYHKLGENFTVVGCFAHCRRKFTEALETISKDKRADSTAGKALDYCTQLYAIEKEIADKNYEVKLRMRQGKSKPILDVFLCLAKNKV